MSQPGQTPPVLSPEILSRVFGAVAAERRHNDIASIRLASSQFRNLASPFLITTVVIADRSDALKKLREVIAHPYFSKYVTHLLWDASAYQEYLVDGLDPYSSVNGGAMWMPSVWSEVKRHVMVREISELGLQNFQSNYRLLEDGEQAAPEPGLSTMEILRRGYDDYRQRFNTQTDLVQRQVSADHMRMAFEKLPKLRHFQFSDFRALVRDGETLGQLCKRLFGHTLSPGMLPDSQWSDEEEWEVFNRCLRKLLEIAPKLESFSVGRCNSKAWDGLQLNSTSRTTIVDQRPHGDNHALWRRLFASVQHLSLPIDFTSLGEMKRFGITIGSPPNRQNFLSYLKPSLVSLELEVVLYSGFHYGPSRRSSRVQLYLAEVLGSQPFQKLDTLVLRGWMISLEYLESFLLAHASSLRKLHLINCCIAGATEAELIESIKWKLSPALALTGVEIYALTYEAYIQQELKLALGQQDQEDLYEPGLDLLDLDVGLLFAPRGPVLEDPHLRSDLEGLFMGGRRNYASRAKLQEGDKKSYEKWWKPVWDEQKRHESLYL